MNAGFVPVLNKLKNKKMKAKKEWSELDHIRVNSALVNYFNYKSFINHRNEKVTMPGLFTNLETVLGLPYTSSSMYAMLSMDCNVKIFHPYETNFYYDHVFVNTDNMVYLVLMNNFENEMIIPIS